MPPNSLIVLQDEAWDGADFAYKPSLNGGSFSYWAQMSGMDCSCAAGVYLVALNDACDIESRQDGTVDPGCPSIDVMQSNNYGFELAAHPCAGGECDAQSMCDFKLRDYGSQQYGKDSWGPGGSIIDTTQWFYMKTEFVTKDTYSSLWKIKTEIYQGGR
jgi:hypothetical protein